MVLVDIPNHSRSFVIDPKRVVSYGITREDGCEYIYIVDRSGSTVRYLGYNGGVQAWMDRLNEIMKEAGRL